MKSLISITIVLILSSKFPTAAKLLQESTPVKYMARYARDQPTLQHRVAKRQTDDDGHAICKAQLSRKSCAQLEHYKQPLRQA